MKYKKFDICLNHNILLSSRKHDFIGECLYIYIYIYIYIYMNIVLTNKYNEKLQSPGALNIKETPGYKQKDNLKNNK